MLLEPLRPVLALRSLREIPLAIRRPEDLKPALLKIAMQRTAQKRVANDTKAATRRKPADVPALMLCSLHAAPRLIHFEDLPRLIR